MQIFSQLAAAVAFCALMCSCTPAPMPEDESESTPTVIPDEGDANHQNNNDNNGTQTMTIQINVGGVIFTAKIEDSETGKAFVAKLPLTLDMSELNGNEKYCYGVELPRADKHFNSIAAGDLMLYSGNCVVLFYGSAGGYSYTRIGKLTGTDGLKEALGTGSIRVTFAKN